MKIRLTNLSAKNISQFLLLCIFLPLLVIEFAMIVADPILSGGFYQYDPDLGFRVRAYAQGANSFGFNDREHPLEKPADSYRILVLGDSFSWAGKGEANYTAILEERLSALRHSGQVEVINAGYPMLGTFEEAELLRKYGLAFNPDMIILSFFVGNDFLESDPFRKRIVVNDSYIDIDRRAETVIFGYPIPPQPRLPVFLKQKLSVLYEQFRLWRNGERGLIMRNEKFLEVERSRMQFCRIDLQGSEARDLQIANVLNAIESINRIARDRNIPFLVSIIPDEFQVSDEVYQAVLKEAPMEVDRFCFQSLLKAELGKRGISSLDLLPRLQEQSADKSLYEWRDTHWNLEGNELAADELYRTIAPSIPK